MLYMMGSWFGVPRGLRPALKGTVAIDSLKDKLIT